MENQKKESTLKFVDAKATLTQFNHVVDWTKVKSTEDIILLLSCLNITFDIKQINSDVLRLLKPIDMNCKDTYITKL